MDEFFYKSQLSLQAKFALYSIYEIRENANDYLLSHDKEHKIMYKEKCFYYIQNLLCAQGNISNVLFNNVTKKRCQRICDFLHINENDYELLSDKNIRNSSEHFDDRLDKLNQIVDETGGAYVDCHIGSRDDVPMLKDVDTFLRRYSPAESTIYFLDRNSKNELAVNIDLLESELKCLAVHLALAPI